MLRSARQAAIDQANLLADYLGETPSVALDLDFILRHIRALDEFAQAAVNDGEGGIYKMILPKDQGANSAPAHN